MAESVRDFAVAITTGIPKVKSATDETDHFTQAVEGATPAVTKLGDEFGASASGPLPEYASGLGLVADEMLTVVKAGESWPTVQRFAKTLTHSPVAGGGMDTTPQQKGSTPFSVTPPPANLQEIYLDQFRQGHDMAGFRDAHHWWEAHLEHMAQLKAAGHASTQGTAFASGGLALVGEMGLELVNLPRGSQVIPNPQLGSEVTVNVNVEGSVVAERDLAQRIRQELIRTSRRTVDLGFN